MIQIYAPGNTNFEQNGDITLMPEDATVSATLGGTWSASLTHPLESDERWRYLQKEAVIKMPSFNGDQLFRIRKCEKTDYEVRCEMDPIFFDSQKEVYITEKVIEEKSGQAALNLLCSGSFSAETDITNTASAEYEDTNLMAALLGSGENSFVNRWGGEPIFDNCKVWLNASAGRDKNVEVRYGKNIPENGMCVSEDMTGVITRIYPVAHNAYRMSNNGYVDSPLALDYEIIYAASVVYEDVKMWEDATAEDEEDPDIIVCFDQDELDAALEQKCLESFEAGVDKCSLTIETDLVLLENTEQYSDISGLETVELGDTVHCCNKLLGITTDARVVSLEYNSIQKRVEKATLGDYRDTYFDSLERELKGIDSIDERLKKITNGDGTVIAEKVKGFLNGAMTQLYAQYDAAEKLDIIAALFENLDATSPTYGALGIGTQGIMISRSRNATGTDWEWTTAMTAEGLIADIIVTGLLSDKTASNYWNLDTGEFKLSGSTLIDNTSITDTLADLEETLEEQIDGKVETWAKATNPASSWTTTATRQKHDGDLWLYTGTSDITVGTVTIHPQGVYQYNGSSNTWSAYSSTSGNLFDLADGKKTIYHGTLYKGTAVPTSSSTRYHYNESSTTTDALEDGDFYYRTSYAYTYRYTASTATWSRFTSADEDDYLVDPYDGCTYKWDGSKWTQVTNYKTAVDTLNRSLTQQEVYNRLTNNSANEGIYLSGGHLYINASMINTGTLAAERVAAGSFTMTGGSIRINSSSLTYDIIQLFYNNRKTFVAAAGMGAYCYTDSTKSSAECSTTLDCYGVDCQDYEDDTHTSVRSGYVEIETDTSAYPYISFFKGTAQALLGFEDGYITANRSFRSTYGFFSDGATSGLYNSQNGGYLIRNNSITAETNFTQIGNANASTRVYSSGNIWKGGSTTTYLATTTTSSDKRLKEDIEGLSGYEDFFKLLKPVAFKYHDGLYNMPTRKPKTKWGFIAQDVLEAFAGTGRDWSESDLVCIEDDDLTEEESKYINNNQMYKINYTNLTALNTHMIQVILKKLERAGIA